MNNEPVAWIAVGDNTSVFFDLDCALAIDDNPTPLYTHPVKEQELLGEIAQLKAELDTANKAYMWMDETYKGVLVELDLLKAHPVKDKPHPKCDEACMYLCQMRELTDEEIMECERWVFLQERMRATNDSWNFTIELARAILRKASEK